MRILFSNEARSGGGGVESYLASVAPALAAAGHDVALLYANTAAERGPTTVPVDPAWSVADLGLAAAIDAARAWRPDVCFAHNMRYLDVERAIVETWPTVKMMHAYAGACLSGHKAFSFPSRQVCPRPCDAGCLLHFLPRRCGRLRPDVMIREYAWARAQQALFPRYRAMVVASRHMRDEFARYAAIAGRLTVIPLFTAAPAGAIGDRDIDVAFFGRLTPLKGPDVLLDALGAAARVLGRTLTAVVGGEGPLRATLATRAQALGRDGSALVEIAGWTPAARRDEILARTRVLALPSCWPEPFGLVGLEAARFGVPSVAFDVGGISSWLTSDVNGVLVDAAGGAEQFGAAIAALLADQVALARLSAGARAASHQFSAEAHVAALESLLAACRSPGTS